MPRHIKEYQLRKSNIKNVIRLAQYLGIDVEDLNKEQIITGVFKRILFEATLSLNIDRGYTVRDTRAR